VSLPFADDLGIRRRLVATRARRAAALLFAFVAASCGGSSHPPAPPDAGVDAGPIDAGRDAAGPVDANVDAPMTCDTDADGDGFVSRACGGDDCDDGNASRYPGATETCDSVGVDEDCDPTTLGPDLDGDSFVSISCCNLQPDGTNTCGTDCNDSPGGANMHPGAPESCNGVDDDCDGVIDDGVTGTFYLDADGDGFGDATHPVAACFAPVGYVANGTDCNDSNAAVHPGATEVFNTIDDNCDGRTDESFEVHGGIEPLGGAASSVSYRVLGGSLTASHTCGTSYCVTGGIAP
jgi:hypothetical protein